MVTIVGLPSAATGVGGELTGPAPGAKPNQFPCRHANAPITPNAAALKKNSRRITWNLLTASLNQIPEVTECYIEPFHDLRPRHDNTRRGTENLKLKRAGE